MSYPQESADGAVPRGLIVDWGGVLTSGLDGVVEGWAAQDGIDLGAYRQVMAAWLGPDAAVEAVLNPIHALERGEMTVPDFEERLADELTVRIGQPIDGDGLLVRMFSQFEHAPDMIGLVRRARSAGVRTALLSNSWGNPYPREGWVDMFDTVVISGEVGMRKPEHRIYAHTVAALDLAPADCVFVDDLPVNVAGAVEAGLIGVHHRDYDATAVELEALFGLTLRS